jgi:hypothetical protein
MRQVRIAVIHSHSLALILRSGQLELSYRAAGGVSKVVSSSPLPTRAGSKPRQLTVKIVSACTPVRQVAPERAGRCTFLPCLVGRVQFWPSLRLAPHGTDGRARLRMYVPPGGVDSDRSASMTTPTTPRCQHRLWSAKRPGSKRRHLSHEPRASHPCRYGRLWRHWSCGWIAHRIDALVAGLG